MEDNMNKTIYDDAYRSMVAELRRGRDRRSLRQSDVEAMLGVSRQWVQKAETCQIRLDVMQVMHLCRLYGIDAPRLVRRVAEELSDEDAPFYLSGVDSVVFQRASPAVWQIGYAQFRESVLHISALSR